MWIFITLCLLLFFYNTANHTVLLQSKQPLLFVWTLSDDTRLVYITPDGYTILIHHGYCFLYENDSDSITSSAIRLDNFKRYRIVRPTRLLEPYQILKPTVLKYNVSKSLTVVDILNQFSV